MIWIDCRKALFQNYTAQNDTSLPVYYVLEAASRSDILEITEEKSYIFQQTRTIHKYIDGRC